MRVPSGMNEIKREVLIVTGQFPPVIGGIGSYAMGIAGALRSVGIGTLAVTSVPRDSAVPKLDYVISGWNWFNHKGVKLLPLMAGAVRGCLRQRPDHVICMNINHEGVVGLMLRRIFALPFSVVVHGSELNMALRNRAKRRLAELVMGRASLVICNSSNAVARVGPVCDPSKAVILHPPVSDDQFIAGCDLTEIDRRYRLAGKTVLLTTATLAPRKNHQLVLSVMHEILPLYPDLVYVITGAGVMEQHLRQLITTLGLADAVRMVGRVSRRDLAGLYRRAALYVSPGVEKSGHLEGFVISFVEAMLAGVPAIAGNAGGVSDCVIDGVTGFTIEPSAQSLKGAILSVLCDTKLRQSLGAAARRYALEHFSYRAQGQRLVELLKLSA